MFKQKIVMEVKSATERCYRFECDIDAPIGEIYDALFKVKETIVQSIKSNLAKEKQELQKEEAPIVPEPTQEYKENCESQEPLVQEPVASEVCDPCVSAECQPCQPEVINEVPSPA